MESNAFIFLTHNFSQRLQCQMHIPPFLSETYITLVVNIVGKFSNHKHPAQRDIFYLAFIIHLGKEIHLNLALEMNTPITPLFPHRIFLLMACPSVDNRNNHQRQVHSICRGLIYLLRSADGDKGIIAGGDFNQVRACPGFEPGPLGAITGIQYRSAIPDYDEMAVGEMDAGKVCSYSRILGHPRCSIPADKDDSIFPHGNIQQIAIRHGRQIIADT